VTRREMKRVGRLMLATYPIITSVAKTTWLVVTILPLLTEVLYDHQAMRSWVIGAVLTASILIPIGGLSIQVQVRPIRSRRSDGQGGSVLQLFIHRDKGVLSWV